MYSCCVVINSRRQLRVCERERSILPEKLFSPNVRKAASSLRHFHASGKPFVVSRSSWAAANGGVTMGV